jgi:hypothetical protein
VLGWPERPPQRKVVDEPEPKKSDNVTDVIASNNPIKSYVDYSKSIFFIENEANYFQVFLPEINKNLHAIKNDLVLLFISLESGNLTRDEFISVVTTCNKIINDAETFHSQIIQEV